ncbi:hypothetical protein [Nocardioides sp.]|uniref:hypothetical protein n=1 Tax=Nocardioides sp. TaxID=35761 RepID=UPI002C2A9EBE|nr:hypothetical protein [Nocardioides sp.]HXH77302.1 hypothetical protein [Nocardioides sp.]
MSKSIPWSVRVDWDHPGTLDQLEAAHMLETLAELRPALVLEETGLPTRYSITVHVDEASLRSAISTALRRVEDATGTRARGVEALTQDTVTRQLAKPNVPALVGHADIADMLGVSRQRAGQLADRPGFPPAVMTIKAGPLRVRDQVEDWARTWDRKSGRPAKTPGQVDA